MEHGEKDIIVKALELISGGDATMGKTMDRVRYMSFAVLCRAMGEVDKKGQNEIIKNYIESSDEIANGLKKIMKEEHNGIRSKSS